MRRKYIWERPEWPSFTWRADRLLAAASDARKRQGEFLGRIGSIGLDERTEAHIETLTEDAVKSSEIEGEMLNREAVRSSVARRLGLGGGAHPPRDARAEGVVAMTVDATQSFSAPLTKDRLLRWHERLFPSFDGRPPEVDVGRWRDDARGAMHVVSGSVDGPTVHFEAPPAARVDGEMAAFLRWYEGPKEYDWLIASAVAHLWFVTIHPFDDGNGRIARAIADMSLARDEQSGRRYSSMSRQIRRERGAYYDILEATQSGDLDVTAWVLWYLGCYARSIDSARETLSDVLHAAQFWHVHARVPFSARQRKVLGRLVDQLEGSLTSRKYARLAGTSEDTALRDINDLIEKRVLVKNPGGSRSTSYSLAEI